MRSKQLPVAALLVGMAILAPGTPPIAAQDATPAMTITCEDVAAQSAGTPDTKVDGMAGMQTGTPMPEMDHMALGLDQMYIDMMIPHHASIVAMAQAALPRLMDERLQAMARSIIDTQSAEIEELRDYRETFFGEAEPMPMDAGMMAAMDEMMPGVSGTMKEMTFQMDGAAQVAVICAAKDTDLIFIDLTIPHHQMAIEASETVAAKAAQEELREFAERVIAEQQREIDELGQIRASLAATATTAQP